MRSNRKISQLVSSLATVLIAGNFFFPGDTYTAHAAMPAAVPALMITEIVPDSTNVTNDAGSSVDGYEYFELYNNSSISVSLNDLKIRYVNGSTTNVWSWQQDGLVIGPNQTKTVWVKSPNLNITLETFNENYHSSVSADQFASVAGQGLANTGARTLQLVGLDGSTIASASFNGSNGDVGANQSILYQYPTDGTEMMRKAAVKQPATPGVIVSGQVPGSTAPAPPAGLSATPGDREVQLNWTPNLDLGVTQYRVIMNGSYTDTISSGNSVTITGLTNFTTYTFSVVAINSSNNSSIPSSIVSVQPQPSIIDSTPPQPPQGLTVIAGEAEVLLNWSPNSEQDLAGYRIYKDNDNVPIQTLASSTNSVSIPALTGNIEYQFQVSAVDTSGNESAKSEPVSAVPSHQIITQEDTGIVHQGDFPQYAEFFDVSAQGPIVPGLKQGLIPQGMHVIKSKNWMITTSYRDDKRASVLTIIDAQTGSLVKTIHMMLDDNVPYSGHAGGIAVSEKYVWLANNYNMYQLSLDAIIQAPDNSNLKFIGKFRTHTKASFGSYTDGVLWVGEYYSTSPGYDTDNSHKLVGRDGKKSNAWLVGYKLDPATDRVPADKIVSPDTAVVPDYIFNITDRVQGATVLNDQILISQTNGASYSSLIQYATKVTDAPYDYIQLNGVSVPHWFLDDVNMADSLYMPSSAEGNFVNQGKVYVLYESGALRIQPEVIYPLDRIQIIDLDAWKKYNTIDIQGLSPTLKRSQAATAKAVLFRGEKGAQEVTNSTTWSSSNPQVAEVEQSGTVRAVTPGETVIQATYGNTTASFHLQVLPSDNALLSGIQMNGANLADFDPAVFTYSVIMPNQQKSASFSAELADPKAVLNMNDHLTGSGESLGPIALAEGANVFRFDVMAEDGKTTAHYVLNVNRSFLPAAPSDVNVRTDHSEATVQWSASSEKDVIGYNVYLGDTKLTNNPILSTSFLVTGLHNGKNYDFSVTAVNGFHEESARSTVSAKIKPTNGKKDN
jgi:chitodextrinase